MSGKTVRRTIDMVRRVCKNYAIEPLVTLTSLSDRCFDMTVPVLFPEHDGDRTAEAYRCFRQLFREGCEIGVAPLPDGCRGHDPPSGALPVLAHGIRYQAGNRSAPDHGARPILELRATTSDLDPAAGAPG